MALRPVLAPIECETAGPNQEVDLHGLTERLRMDTSAQVPTHRRPRNLTVSTATFLHFYMAAKPPVWSLILTPEKSRYVSIGERTWDNGGHVHESGLSTCTDNSL